MSGYVFVENSNKPSLEEANSRAPIKLDNVSIPCLIAAMDMGYSVFLGVNRNNPDTLQCDYPIHLYDSHTYRSLAAFNDNKIAFHNLDKLVKENDIQVIHCNTPIGGMIGRLVGKRNKVNKVIYTAHGFHFYKGAPIINRTVFKLAEKTMAHWTDAIITMNKEDYEAAKRFKLKKGGKVYLVHGVGINLEDFSVEQSKRTEKRNEFGLSEDDVVVITTGDLIKRKNYGVAISAIAECHNEHLHYMICGIGPEEKELRELTSDLHISDQVHFLGFRSDVKELLNASDIFLFTSFQEGMPRSMMEAMACGLPCIASDIRGNVDLIINGINGYLCNPNDVKAFSKRLAELSENISLRNEMGKKNLSIIKPYDVKEVTKEIKRIYAEVLV